MMQGDVRETEFILEEVYITHFLEEAEIQSNDSNIDLLVIQVGSPDELPKYIAYK